MNPATFSFAWSHTDTRHKAVRELQGGTGRERGVCFWLLNCGQAALETEDQKAKIKELAIMFHSKGRRKVSGHWIKPEARIPVRMQEG